MAVPHEPLGSGGRPGNMPLSDGSRVAVIGGGPSGAFSAYFLSHTASRVGIDLDIDLYEPRDFSKPGPQGCNMCGGVISESLIQNLATEGINFPASVIQRRLDSYVLHMDVGSVRIETPNREKRIAAVHRGSGPRFVDAPLTSFDAHLFERALARGARLVPQRVKRIDRSGERPRLETAEGGTDPYDLVVVGTGVNAPLLKTIEEDGNGYRRPRTTKTTICDLPMDRWMLERYLGNSMHVFLLDIPRLHFAAIIPKSVCATVCLLGEDMDKDLLTAFLATPEVRACMPPHWRFPETFCQCSPKMFAGPAVNPFSDRVVFVGDCGSSRLYKDGIGAAYRTAKAMANAAVFHGVSAEGFRRHYAPACRRIGRDNDLGRIVFGVTGLIQKTRASRTAVWRMASAEKNGGGRARMGDVLWDTFTGSASYRSVLGRSLHPAFLGRLLWEGAAGIVQKDASSRRGSDRMSSITGVMGKKYRDGEAIFHQGERGECMYVIQEGAAEVIRREGDKEFCLAQLGKGDSFGELAVFGEPVRPTTVRAVGKCYVFTLEKEMLLERLHEDPSIAFALLQKMAQHIKLLERAIARVGGLAWEEVVEEIRGAKAEA